MTPNTKTELNKMATLTRPQAHEARLRQAPSWKKTLHVLSDFRVWVLTAICSIIFLNKKLMKLYIHSNFLSTI